MSAAKKQIRQILFRALGKDPEAVVVSFATGPRDRVVQMVEEVRRLIPDRRHFLVTTGELLITDVETVQVEPGSSLSLYFQLRTRLRRYRIGMTPVLLHDPSHTALRRSAYLLAPGKILAFNQSLERHHLQLRSWLASLLFARGVPLDRIHLRPWGLFTNDRTEVPGDPVILEGRAPRPKHSRVGVLTPFAPYPLSHGGAVRLFNLTRELAKEFDVYLFTFREKESAAQLQPLLEFCSAIAMVTKPRYREPRWASLAPPEVNEYESEPMRSLLARVRADRGINVLQVEYTQLARYDGDVLVEHDVTFDLYQQLYDRNPTRAAWWNWWRWNRFERDAVRHFRRVVVMSDKDAKLLGTADARVVPNGVDLDRFRPTEELAGRRLLFIGSFRHFPNVTAFRFLIEEVWPIVSRDFPEASLEVVAGPDPELYCRELPTDPRVRIHSFVADVRPLYRETNVVLVPTLVSAGTNVKVLEAMAMKRAIVATTSGVGGIDVAPGRHVWIADGGAAFAACIAKLLLEPATRRELAEAAYHFVAERYGWNRIGELQREVIRELLPQSVVIRDGTVADVSRVRQIQRDALPSSRWDAEHYLRHEFYVATVEGEVAGFVVARQTAPDEREILNVAVSPHFRRQGIGERLLRRLIAGGHGDVFLEVRESNVEAQKLYLRVGFERVGLRPGYYDDPPETAVIMRVRQDSSTSQA